MVGPDRLGAWIGHMAREQEKNHGELTVEKAKTMLALSVLIQQAATDFLIKHQMEDTS